MCVVNLEQFFKLCDGFAFISGWNRCFLRQKVSRTVSIRIYTGVLDEARNLLSGTPDADNSGKDLRLVPHTKNEKACLAHCQAEISPSRFWSSPFLPGLEGQI